MVDGARRGEGGVLMIEGAAGLGKSALLSFARDRASERDFQVVAARGDDLEREFAFGVVRQLFERLVAAAGTQKPERLLAGAARLAVPLLGVEEANQPGERTRD